MGSGLGDACHNQVAERFIDGVFYAYPGRPWERALNENTNGLLRPYFPKRADLSIPNDRSAERAAGAHRTKRVQGDRTLAGPVRPHELLLQICLAFRLGLSQVAEPATHRASERLPGQPPHGVIRRATVAPHVTSSKANPRATSWSLTASTNPTTRRQRARCGTPMNVLFEPDSSGLPSTTTRPRCRS